MRELFLRAAEGLEQRGFFATPRLFLITEAKALEVELRGITNAAAKDDQVPGWRTFFEGKVHVNADGTDLVPVMAMESTQNQYASHEAAVIDAAHARARKPLTDEEYEKGLAQVSVKLRGACPACRQARRRAPGADARRPARDPPSADGPLRRRHARAPRPRHEG
jgi:hypothetical protein